MSIVAHLPARPVRLLLTLTLAAMLLTLLTPLGGRPADAAVGDPSIVQCFSGSALPGCTEAGPPLSGYDVEVSPDGRQVYVLSQVPASLRLFDRAAGGGLTARPGPTGCYNATGDNSCTVLPALAAGTPWDLTITADGTSVYVAGGAAVIGLARSTQTGTLSENGCYGALAGCTSVTSFNQAYAVAASPDGTSLYVRGNNTMLVFDRDAATGTLTQKPGASGCFAETALAGCTDSFGLKANAFEMAVSADGKFVYYPIQAPGGIGFFIRGADGTLSQIAGPQGGCITTDGSSTVAGECAVIPDGSGPAVANAWGVTVSPSGKHVLLGGSQGTMVFARAADTGKLTKTDCVSTYLVTGCQQAKGSAGMRAVISADGHRALVGAVDVAGLGVFAFDESTGTLTQLPGPLGCYSWVAAGCTPIASGNTYGKPTFGPSGHDAYFVTTAALYHLQLDVAPTCQAVNATVPPATPTKVQLSCTDANGDPVTLGTATSPAHGLLSALDAATSSLTYTPDAGFSGTDSFTYSATANGVTSAPATVTLTVQPPPPTPPTPPDTTVSLTITGGRLAVSAKGKVRVSLACPATETHGPCVGKVKLRTRTKVDVGIRNKVVVLGKAAYSIPAGAAKGVVVKLGDTNLKLLSRDRDARKILVIATVTDGAGNRAVVNEKAKLRLN